MLMTKSIFMRFFFYHQATSKIYTLSLHDALPISRADRRRRCARHGPSHADRHRAWRHARPRGRRLRAMRSEEHTSELQSPYDLVCRLLLEKKKKLFIDYVSLLGSSCMCVLINYNI